MSKVYCKKSAAPKATENASIQKRLIIILASVFIFIAVVTFGLFQIAKGAKFHELNILHLKHTLELSELITELQVMELEANEKHEVEHLAKTIENIRAQPLTCLQIITPLDAFIMRLISTDAAIKLCVDDITIADNALSALEKHQRGSLSATKLYQELLFARQQFSKHSAQFQQPVQRTVDFTVVSTTFIIMIMGVLVVGAIITLSRGISQTVATMQQTSAELAISEEQNRQLAHYDNLSGLPNRNLFMKQLDYAIAQADRENKTFALLFIDLDRFKSVNDTLGHIVGDKLLKMTADRLSNVVRKSDVVARLGGDEFTIILTNQSNLEHVSIIAENILLSLEKPFLINGTEVFVTGSVGITIYPNDAKKAVALIKNADVAMYQSKANGKNKFEFYSADLDAKARIRLELEQELRKSISQNELCLYYQPIIRLSDMQTVGAEALIRWNHPLKGMISPADFIPIAEEIGLIVNIGEWVLYKACAQLQAWHSAGHDEFKLTVNVSVSQLNAGHFAASVRDAIEQSGVRPDRLGLEITESLFVENDPTCMDTLHELHEIGVELLLDDFGTGYSSFSYLHTLPFDLLKIDRSFVQEITKVGDAKEIAASIISMAHTLKMQVTAEGVETADELPYLNERNCEYVQGFLFDKPMPAGEFNCNKTYKELLEAAILCV